MDDFGHGLGCWDYDFILYLGPLLAANQPPLFELWRVKKSAKFPCLDPFFNGRMFLG
jgi:hypothetical protein